MYAKLWDFLSLDTVAEKRCSHAVPCIGSKLLDQLGLDVIEAGCFAVLQYSDADVEFRAAENALVDSGSSGYRCRSMRTFGCLFGTLPLSRSWCATWFAVVLQCCFGLHGSSQSLRIVDPASVLAVVGHVCWFDHSLPCFTTFLWDGAHQFLTESDGVICEGIVQSSYFSPYSSISSLDSGVRPGMEFLLHPGRMFFRATFRRAFTNWS